jgi:uroporphyrinogen decarboxylase
MTMTPRERVLTALRRQRPDRVPKTFSLTPGLYDEFRRRTGQEDVSEYFRLEPRSVGIGGTCQPRDFSPYLADVPNLDHHDEWGVGAISAGFHHFERMVHPLRDAESPRDIANYPWPDVLAPYRWTALGGNVASWHSREYPVCAGPPGACGGSLFETCWYLRGQEQLLIDLYDNPDLATALLDTVNNTMIESACRLARSDVDILHLGDDVGSQRAMLMSPDTWRRWFKPRLADLIRAAKAVKPNMLVFYHSDGNIEPIIPDLIEIGLDILNPVQPECMDPAQLKREYGGDLAFWGTIGTQSTMPFGDPEEVRRVVKERIETVGPEGLLLAPTHVVEPDVPWDNIVAFVEAVEEYGDFS